MSMPRLTLSTKLEYEQAASQSAPQPQLSYARLLLESESEVANQSILTVHAAQPFGDRENGR